MSDHQAKKYTLLSDTKPAYSLMSVGKLLAKVRGLNCQRMEDLARVLGIKIAYSTSFNPKVAGVYDVQDGQPYIIVNRLLNNAIQEFTIAHEIAHHCLHHNRINRKLEYVEDSEANLFAYKLLVEGNASAENGDMFLCNSDAIEMALDLLLRGSLGIRRAGKSRFVYRLFADKTSADQEDSQ